LTVDDLFEEPKGAPDPRAHSPAGVVLEAHQLRKAFGADEALRGVSVRIWAGEVVAVTGPSGCGKSTLLHCLAGVLRPDSGSVLYQGRDISMLAPKEVSALRRESFGFVFQSGQLVPELRAVDDVALPLVLGGISRRSALERAHAMLERVGVGHLADRRPDHLSGGQAQRVAIARALIAQPQVVFADEPTGALDSETGQAVMDLFLELVAQNGVTLVVVTHDPRVAAQAGRVLAMSDGAVEGGTV
jgi:putative ABC transport system ATP-binding protein